MIKLQRKNKKWYVFENNEVMTFHFKESAIAYIIELHRWNAIIKGKKA